AEDSYYIRYEQGNTDFYYSNVQLLSVLQAAPVYEELGEDYVSGAETSYAKSSGESSGTGHTHEVSAGAIMGFEHETSFLGLVNLFTMEVTAQLAVTAGWEFEKTAEKEFTTTYNTGGTEDVAVLYTVPYVRYNAQIYIPKYTLPTKEEYDAKKAFYEELIANIQEYKDSGAGVTGKTYANPKDGYNNDYTTNVLKSNYDYQLQVLQTYAQWLKETESQMEGFEGSAGMEWGTEVEGGWEDYFFCVPQTPLITSVTTETYDRIAESNEGMESLYGSALPKDYAAGCPDTYVQDQADLKKRTSLVDKSLEEGKTNAGENGELGDGFISSTSISASSSSPSQTIAFTEENSKSTSVGGELSLEVTATVAEVKGGVAVSTNHAATWSSSTTKGCEFSGTVPNLPERPDGITEKEYSNYDYKWKLISYQAMVNGAKVPVVGYYTKYDNRTLIPPSAPVDAQIENVTSNSITLTWNAGKRAADHYNVYQVTGNGSNKKYEKLQTVAASGQKDGVYSFTHSDLKQDVEYTYVVAAFNTNESVRSVYSDALTARTLVPEFNVKVNVNGIDSAKTYLAGTELELDAELETGNYPQSEISQYFWQINKGNGWKKLSGIDTESCPLRALASMNGYKYRCIAYVSVDNRLYQLASEEVVLNVRKAEVTISIRADKQEGAADSSSEFGLAESDADVLELTAIVTSDDLEEISGQVVFHITNDVSRAAGNDYSAELSNQGVAKKKCRIQKEGHYTISASYVESETVANADSGNTLPYFAYNASQKEDREAGKQMEQEIYEKEWDDLNLKNVLGLKNEIKDLNEKYNNFDKQEFVETAAKNKLKNAADLLEAAEVLELINSFSGLTAANVAGKKEEIQKAREAYNQLSDAQKELLKDENVEEKLNAVEALLAAATKPNPQNPGTTVSDPDQKQIANISKKLNVSTETAGKIKKYADKYEIDMDTVLLTDQDIAGIKTDKDVKGSSYGKLQAKTSKVTAGKIKLTWKKAKGADGYRIYQAECGKKKGYKLIKDIKKKSAKSYTVKKLKKGKGYRFLICAYKVIDGKNITVSVAKTVHAFTNGGKKGNVTKVKTGKTKLNLKQNKKYKLKVSVKKTKKKGVKCRGICYESSNPKVATVTSKGKITAKGKGKCTIYVYAHNGVCTPVVIKVK
ncbi:MAG: fibronectin type III domain-containing protein, partial [Lachnospiraceae bacterium]|nr:fibronectin type III domain-containing protein [Lachnospiraceae bacterium]